MITSTANAKVKRLVSLGRKSKARYEEGVFLVEGVKMFQEAPAEWIREVYVSESFLEKNAFENEKRVHYETVSDEVFRKISDTQTPQGILSLVQMPQYGLSSLLQGERTHLLVVESVQDPGNLGTMLRTGEGAGITGVIMNKTTVDLFHPKTIRSTMGSIYRVPYYVTDDLAGTIQELKRQRIRVYAAHLRGTMEYDEPSYTGGCAFLIGNEGKGLTDETAELADAYIRIPMEGEVESLNAAVSAALLMYETNRQRRRSGHENLV